MPSAIVADGVASGHPSQVDDTRTGALSGVAAALIAQLWAPNFPSPELLREAAALIPAARAAADVDQLLDEGPRPFLRVGPGVVELRTKDYARAERAAERARHRREIDVELLAAYVEEHGAFPDKPTPTRVITEWSRKSRAYMVRTIGSLDFTPMYSDPSRLPGMLTLTYSGDWLVVAPNGEAVKAHLKALRKRYQRAYGEVLRCVWKLEFQRRGAPHIHMLMVPPHKLIDGQHFNQWVRRAWADIVAHPDPDEYARHAAAGTRVDYGEGMRASDPKRVGVYFSKHGSFADKEYQNQVPEEWQEPGSGPGRFWGYWGLEKTTVTVELDWDTFLQLGRVMRRWAAAQGVTRETARRRVKGGRVLPRYAEVIGLAGKQFVQAHPEIERTRRSRTRARRMAGGRGFVMVNSGPEFVSQLSRFLDGLGLGLVDGEMVFGEDLDGFTRRQRQADYRAVRMAKLGIVDVTYQPEVDPRRRPAAPAEPRRPRELPPRPARQLGLFR